MSWKDHLTPDEATRLAILATRITDCREEKLAIYKRAHQRMTRAIFRELAQERKDKA